MANTCSICRSANRQAIETALIGGASLRAVGQQFGVSKSALARHQSHLQPVLREQLSQIEEARGLSVRGEAVKLLDRLKRALAAAEEEAGAGNWQGLRGLSAELRKSLELLARLTGELGDRDKPTVTGPSIIIVQPRLDPQTGALMEPVIIDTPGCIQPAPEPLGALALPPSNREEP